MEATGGFEPPNRGFADLRLSPLGYVASNCAGNWAPGPGPIMVPRAGLEPTRAYAHGPLKTACLPIPPPRPVDACRIITYLPGATRFSSPMKLFRADESQWPGTRHSGPRRNPARLTANTGRAWQGTLDAGFRRYDGAGQQGNPPILNTFSPIAGQSRLGLAVNYPSTFSSESASPEPYIRAPISPIQVGRREPVPGCAAFEAGPDRRNLADTRGGAEVSSTPPASVGPAAASLSGRKTGGPSATC